MLRPDDALHLILSRVRRLGAEEVALADCLGRVLASDAIADRQLPPVDNSAMDGFAVRAGDVPGELPIAGVIAAGDRPGTTLPPGRALKIMTGAPLPAGADSVVIREDVEERDGVAVFSAAAVIGDNIRRAGEDVAPGDRAIAAGSTIGPGELGLCAALGMASLPVARRPQVAVLSTGDELVELGGEIGPGQIVSSNAWALAGQVIQAGGSPVSLGIARDDRAEIERRVRDGLGADVLLTSGGVSVGDFDLVKEAMAAAGIALDLWKVAIKPGKPLAFGVAPTGTLVFGLPGNPVSAMVSFELFARPALRALLGATALHRPRAPVMLPRGYRKPAGRAHFLRARVIRRDGSLVAELHGRQGSGMLSSMVGVNALIEIAADVTEVAPGASVSALLLEPV